jgi:Uma2 family endonuclease
MYDLPSEDPEEPGLPDEYHIWQPQFLSFTCCPPLYPPDRVFVATDMNLYYDPRHPLWHKRPDWFVVVNVPRLYEDKQMRLSYVTWQEGVRPLVVVELLSPSTRDEDLGLTPPPENKPPGKWEVYERILGIPYYIVFDRYTDELQAFQLEGGHYRQMAQQLSRVWIPELQLSLGLWQGEYRGIDRQWLRWYDAQGNLMLTDAEQERLAKEQERLAKEQECLAKEQERLAKEQERLAKEQAQALLAQERQQRQQLIERLRARGIDPDEFLR